MQDSHRKAAEYHDLATHAHNLAAENYGKQDHLTGHEYSRRALEHSNRAHEFAETARRSELESRKVPDSKVETDSVIPNSTHAAAACHHERAAESHRAAAQQSSTGDHEAWQRSAAEALEHSKKADAASRRAHHDSAQHATASAFAR